ncbi:hypothetical protein Syun_021800 [Stephania yunnanensis]|uniref:MPN domain-containing protein n=1 Tax=Stephania yunnanensis TaxID=152371 RepID=A0AAP0IGF4_9MAGN
MRTSNGGFSIAANTRKLEVDNRIALRYYYRIADNLLKQADIFREEKNVIDLYIMLLRFSGLITETIPCHRDYKSSLQREKILFKKKLLLAMNELEILNPIAKQKVEELNVKNSNQVSRQAYYKKNDYFDSSSEWPSAKDQISKSFQFVGLLDKVKPTIQMDIVRQPSPPPMLADVQDLIPAMPPQVTDLGCKLEDSLQDELIRSKSPLELHISTSMMDNFMRLAKVNTDRNLETCGVLAGSLKNKKFFVTALIIPKQESTSDSCQATNEEEIFDVQDKQSLFPLGWIHIMLPEAVAIVMAPKDSSRKHGIFRLTSPGGMSVIRNCDRRGFHPHEPPPDGGPIYDHCTDFTLLASSEKDRWLRINHSGPHNQKSSNCYCAAIMVTILGKEMPKMGPTEHVRECNVVARVHALPLCHYVRRVSLCPSIVHMGILEP